MATHSPRAMLLVLLLCSCGASGSDEGHVEHPFAGTVEAISVEWLDEIHGPWVDAHRMTICQMAAFSPAGAGIFEVREIVVVGERHGAEEISVLYVNLESEEPWAGDLRSTEVVRMELGTATVYPFDLRVGERVVAFLRGGSATWNEGFSVLWPTHLFHFVDGRWLGTNYALETSTLREAAEAAYTSFRPGEFSVDDCGVEIDFARCPSESLIPPDAVRFDAPCIEESDAP